MHRTGDVTAEELFNMFFGGAFPSTTVYSSGRRRAHYTHTHTHGNSGNQTEANNLTMLLQLLPILFFIVVTLISSFFVSDPLYSLSRTQK